LEERLRQGLLRPQELYELWRSQRPVPALSHETSAASPPPGGVAPWMQSRALVGRFVERAIEVGEFLLACDAARHALQLHPGDIALQQGLAAALARLGVTDEARQILRTLAAADGLAPADVCRTHLLTGDIMLREARAAEFDEARHAALRAALEAYALASDARPEAIAPLVASAVAMLQRGLAGRAQAEALAQRALQLLDAGPPGDGPACDRQLARAHAAAVLGRTEQAKADYRTAAAQPSVAAHELGAARRDARAIAGARGEPESLFDECFPPLQLIVFAGHMPDAPGRTPPRFPAGEEARVRDRIRERLAHVQARVGFCSAAAGCDLLFIEEMNARDGVVHLVLPWSIEAFLGTSVTPYGTPWVERFQRAIAQAVSVRVLGELLPPQDSVGLNYATAVLAGLARLTARALDLDVVPLAVWDGQPGSPGGTGAFVDLWRQQAIAPEVIDIGAASQRVPVTAAGVAPASPSARLSLRQEIKTMLFADVVGYSSMPEQLGPAFVTEFKGRVSRLIAESAYAPIDVETWGDGLYFVFDDATSGGLFALELTDMIASVAWDAIGLRWDHGHGAAAEAHAFSLRTALHSGPVFVHFEPIVRRVGFTGAHVNRAARIEPVTVPGAVFASESFAALAAGERAQGFCCDFVGTLPLAKNYPGEFRIYRVRRTRQLPLDALGRILHEQYCLLAMRRRGETVATNPLLRPWEELPADLQSANREQAADIPAKLRAIGYELEPCRPGAGVSLELSASELEELARREHDRWCESKRAHGWAYAPGPQDPSRLTHPALMQWNELPEAEREKNLDAVREIPNLLAKAGFRVRRSLRLP
jgi:class 3 adenylate cyclase